MGLGGCGLFVLDRRRSEPYAAIVWSALNSKVKSQPNGTADSEDCSGTPIGMGQYAEPASETVVPNGMALDCSSNVSA